MSAEITPEDVVRDLFLADGTVYDDNGVGWLHTIEADGNSVKIAITPIDDEGMETGEPVHFRAVVVEGDQTPIVLDHPEIVGYFDDDTQLVIHHGLICSQGIRRGDWTPAQAREFAAHLAALADQAEAQAGGDV